MNKLGIVKLHYKYVNLQILLPNPTRSVTAKIGNLNSSILIFNEYS